jgi:hypothetical protein
MLTWIVEELNLIQLRQKWVKWQAVLNNVMNIKIS